MLPSASSASEVHDMPPKTSRCTARCPCPTSIPFEIRTSSPTMTPPRKATAQRGPVVRRMIASVPKNTRTNSAATSPQMMPRKG